jgi:hypothetical protein
MIGDIAFLFLDVLLVILVIENLLTQKEKKGIRKKLNMAIGTFFSEVGLEVLKRLPVFVENAPSLTRDLRFEGRWTKRDFLRAQALAQKFAFEIKFDKESLGKMREFLIAKRPFLLTLLENPNLLEHERFTDLLWAVFHLMEELEYRGDNLSALPQSDTLHLAGDLKRVYSQIMSEWLAYTQHLKASYPFLFSLAARMNPLNPDSSPIVSYSSPS